MPKQLHPPPVGRPNRIPLKGVPGIPDRARLFMLRDIPLPPELEAECDTVINKARVEITRRYREAKIERTAFSDTATE